MKKVAIIGAGASGLACASSFQAKDIEILVFEQFDKSARKLLATGNGRCNISNTEMQMEFYNTNNPIISNIIMNFNVTEFFLKRKLLLKQEGTLLYPFSNQAKSVKDCLLNCLTHTKIISQQKVITIKHEKNGYSINTFSDRYFVDYVVLAIGSNAGIMANQDNYQLIQNLNIPLTNCHPSLVQFVTKKVYKQLKGVRVKGQVSLYDNNQLIASRIGEIQFTDYGLSGICVMQLSRYYHQCHQPQLHIDLLPQYPNDQELLEKYGLEGIFPEKLVAVLQKEKIALKKWVMDIVETKSAPFAQVIQGGIDLNQINEDLEIKQYPNMFAIGEVLDVDGDCGGYNLHFAFGSGQYVAKIIEERVKKC